MDDMEFRIKIHKLLCNPNQPLFDWGTNMNANEYIYYNLKKRIEKHPIIWKLFFMI